MANLNIAIQISAKDNASGPIGKITTALGGLKDRGLGGLQAAGKVALTGIATGAGLAVTAVGLIGGAAFGVANDVQTATGEIQSALGTTTEEASNLAGIARDVWGNNFSGSISEAAGAVGLVRQQLGDLSNNEMQDATENAFRLSDAYGEEVPGSIGAAKALMEEFGLTQQEAFDFLAKGFQDGLNASDDFIDSIGEYSNQFGDLGFSADEFFSIMASGQAAGVLGTDKIADAVKEMNIRLTEGGDEVAGAFGAIGLNFAEVQGTVASGESTWADYFDEIVGGINGIEDPIARQQAQVAIFGTMAEDLGVSFTEGLSSATTSLDDMAGAVDAVDSRYNNLGSAAEGYRRRALLALEPIGNVLLDLANNAMPLVDSAFAVFETSIVPAIETAAEVIQTFLDNLSNGQGPLDAFIGAVEGLAPPEVIAFLVDLRDNILPGLSAWFVENVQPVIDMVTSFVSWQDVLTGLGVVLASVIIPAAVTLIGSILAIAAPIALVIGAVALLRTAWEQNWGGIQEKTGAALAWIQGTISSVISGVQAFWQAHGDQILLAAQLAWTGIQTAVNTAITTVQSIITTVVTAVQTFWQQHGETIMTAAETAWQFIQDYIDTALSVIDSVWQAFKSAFEGDWHGFGENLREAAETAWEFIKTTFREAGLALLEWVSGFVLDLLAKFNDTDWGEVGRNIIQGIANAITGGVGMITDAARAAAQAALDAAKGLLGIESPSKVAALQVGTPFVQGVAQGLENLNPLRGALNGLSSTLVSGALPSSAGPRGAARPALAGGGGATIVFQAGAIQIGGREAPGGLVRDLKTAVNQAVDEALARSGQRADRRIRNRS